jgi:ABC-type branched-subunit amino acid transport system ATPase component
VTALLEVENVVRRFGGVRAVDGVSFGVERHSITGLIGPNGAGKSTLFGVIAGSLQPDSGRISFDGHRIDRRPAYRVARAGVVRTYQAARVLTRMTVLDNLMLASFRHPGERLSGIALRPRASRASATCTRKHVSCSPSSVCSRTSANTRGRSRADNASSSTSHVC